MALIKTKDEIAKITKSCQILAEVKQILYDLVSPGISLEALDAIAFKEITKRGAKPAFLGLYGFPKTICISVNDELIHGIPSNYIIQENDVVKIDAGCIYEGYNSDSAFTKIAGEGTYADKKLVEVAKNAFYAGFNAIKKGARVGDISHAIGTYIKKQGYFTPKEFTGHGIGKKLHEDPYVPNDGKPGTGMLLQDGMVICIEPMILQNSPKIKIAQDG